MILRLARSILLLTLLATSACSGVQKTGEPTYADSAEKNFQAGLSARDSGRFEEAIKYFEEVRFKYPYTVFAARADMELANTDFERERYLEAAEGYRQFLKLHPTHPETDFAQFRLAMSYVEDTPSSFFLFPDPSEKDQGSPREALRTLRDFLRIYPNSKYAPEAKTELLRVEKLLARHEMAIANYYLKQGHFPGAVLRLQTLMSTFPGSALEGEALLKLGKAHAATRAYAEARTAWESLIRNHAGTPEATEAAHLLTGLPAAAP